MSDTTPRDGVANWYNPRALKRRDTYRDEEGDATIYLCAEKLARKANGEWFFAWDVPKHTRGSAPLVRRMLHIECDQDGEWFVHTPSDKIEEMRGTMQNIDGLYVKEYELGKLSYEQRWTLERIATDVAEPGRQPIGCPYDWARCVLDECVRRRMFFLERVQVVKQLATDQNDPRKSEWRSSINILS
ncbi:hypothetical protein PsYK624_056170 [Phanerochaete sordida]|uniref:Uncharacterized protein n=1 Tax=Phanerochaete sordida TaxID=48140 RepID=A0A9P3LBS9_9APHY|nr:hypothetical protein PsYK624_056170 [Phanerochaete sordida]